MQTKISVVVVDDEKPARRRLIELLEKSPEIGPVSECTNGQEALQVILKDFPDLLFLDIQMPEMDGFGVLAQLPPEHTPATIFVTAYDQFALRAFEMCAQDYLLKPYSDERFEACLSRAIEHIRMRERADLDGRLHELMQMWSTKGQNGRHIDRLAIKSAGRVLFLDVCEIVRIEGAGVYVDVHTRDKTYLYRATLGELEARLDPAKFVRIHRSMIVNVRLVRELRSQSHGDCALILKDGTELKLSRNYRTKLEDVFGQTI